MRSNLLQNGRNICALLAAPIIGIASGTILTTAGEAQTTLPAAAAANAQSAAPLGSAERSEIVRNVAAAAETSYADAEAGARLAQRLQHRLASGAYDAYADPAGLAAALTADLRAVVDDVHLRVVHEPDRSVATPTMRRLAAPGAPNGARTGPGGGAAPGPQVFARIDGRSRAAIARTNYGFERVERLTGNVGYLKLTRFVPLDYSSATAQAAMAFLANADAVIIDLRGVPGGSPELVQLLLSYFSGPEPRRFMTIYNRPLDRTEESWTLADVPGQRLAGRPLFILLDRDSASAAEMLAYGVQRLRLGTIVGETSAGAGNGGNMIALGSGLSLFLPQMRIIDGPGWEQTGVRPDVESAGADALGIAHATALEQLVAQAQDPAQRREREQSLERLRNAPAPAPPTSRTVPTT